MKDKNNQEKLFISSDGPGHDLEWVQFQYVCMYVCMYVYMFARK